MLSLSPAYVYQKDEGAYLGKIVSSNYFTGTHLLVLALKRGENASQS